MHIDRHIFFSSLGFLAVLLQETPQDKQALRATTIAELIESFCNMQGSNTDDISPALHIYLSELREHGSAELSHDRDMLLDMYDQLILLNLHDEQKEFYASAPEELIAARLLQMAEQKLRHESEAS